MSLLHCNFDSKTLEQSLDLNIIYPDNPIGEVQTLYLLHGYAGDYSNWCRFTNIEMYSKKYNLAIVMPSAANSFYNNFKRSGRGYKYWDFISDEVLNFTRKMFRLSTEREDTFVAGLSMGGFGALKLALNKPNIFSHGASLSGVVNLTKLLQDEESKDMCKMVIGDSKIEETENDLIFVSKQLSKKSIKPKIYQCCGTEDFLYEQNLEFKKEFEFLSYDYTYEESKGIHDWIFWDKYIKKILEWLPLKEIKS